MSPAPWPKATLMPASTSPRFQHHRRHDGGSSQRHLRRQLIAASTLAAHSATGNMVEGNYIGTSADGLHALGNASYGVRVDNAATQHHRRPDQHSGDRAGNIISGNGSGTANGISIIGSGRQRQPGGRATSSALDADGSTTLGSGQEIGVEHRLVRDRQHHRRHGQRRPATSSPATQTASISGSPSGNVVAGNYIGTDITGTAQARQHGHWHRTGAAGQQPPCRATPSAARRAGPATSSPATATTASG